MPAPPVVRAFCPRPNGLTGTTDVSAHDSKAGYREKGTRPVLMKVAGVPDNHRGWIACAGKRDGLGAQFQALMSTILFADWMNLEYVHTPLRCVDHDPGGHSDWTADCEAFINIMDSFPSIESLKGFRLEASSDFRRATARERGGNLCDATLPWLCELVSGRLLFDPEAIAGRISRF